MNKVMALWAACNVVVFWDVQWLAVLNALAVGLLLGLDATRRTLP